MASDRTDLLYGRVFQPRWRLYLSTNWILRGEINKGCTKALPCVAHLHPTPLWRSRCTHIQYQYCQVTKPTDVHCRLQRSAYRDTKASCLPGVRDWHIAGFNDLLQQACHELSIFVRVTIYCWRQETITSVTRNITVDQASGDRVTPAKRYGYIWHIQLWIWRP